MADENIRNRNLGEVYTPNDIVKLFFDTTNKYIPNFNKTHAIWDCCWGTGNLTAPFEFDDLFCSTLRLIDIKKNRDKNKNAVKFAYNFLDKDVDQLVSKQAMWVGQNELPDELVDRLNGDKPFLFYINPPYVSTGVMGANEESRDEETTSSKIKNVMREHAMGSACNQLYAQFLYKILLMKDAYKNKNISIALIASPMFLSGSSYSKFRERLFSNFKFEGGAIFKASKFPGLSDTWGIAIMIMTPGNTDNKKGFELDVYEDDEKGNFLKTGVKEVYNLDGEEIAINWVRRNVLDIPTTVGPVMSSGCKVKEGEIAQVPENSHGYLFYNANNVYHNMQGVGILSSAYSGSSWVPILDKNFDDCISLFIARRCFGANEDDWLNDKDEYAVPNTECNAYRELVDNGYIYSICDTSSGQASLVLKDDTGITRIKNGLFFMDYDEINKLAQDNGIELQGTDDISQRILVRKINEAIERGMLWDETLEILEGLREIFRDTMKYREEFNRINPNYQVLNWDAGFYQIKQILKHVDKEAFRVFNRDKNIVRDKFRQLVYECGYLRGQKV